MSEPPAVVLDTNVWIDWLVFDDPSIRRLQRAVESGGLRVVIDPDALEELRRVLERRLGRRSLDEAARAAALARCRKLSAEVPLGVEALARLPQCKDPDDQKFLALTARSGAVALVTRDKALLALGRRVPFAIRRPEDLDLY